MKKAIVKWQLIVVDGLLKLINSIKIDLLIGLLKLVPKNFCHFPYYDLYFRSRWRNGLVRLQQSPCYLQGPGFESHLRPVEFFAYNKVSPLNYRTLMLTSVPCALIN